MKKTNFFRIFAAMIITAIALSGAAIAKDNAKMNKSEVKFKTSAYSFMCKDQIENELRKQSGVEEAYLDLETKIVTVTYNPTDVRTEQLENTIEGLGYESEPVKDDCTKTVDKKCCDKDKKNS
ncbi:MAG: heavy-metal-associated domain-containing protein [Candidatus Kapaibacterium sp.]